MARRIAGDRPPRAPAPRRAAVVHRPRRPPLPGHPHRPARGDVARARVPATERARAPRIASAPPRRPAWRTSPSATSPTTRSGWRSSLTAQDLIAYTQRLALDGELARCEPKTTALPTAARRRPAGLPRPPRHPAPATHLALGRPPGHRLRTPRRAAPTSTLTKPVVADHHAPFRPSASDHRCATSASTPPPTSPNRRLQPPPRRPRALTLPQTPRHLPPTRTHQVHERSGLGRRGAGNRVGCTATESFTWHGWPIQEAGSRRAAGNDDMTPRVLSWTTRGRAVRARADGRHRKSEHNRRANSTVS